MLEFFIVMCFCFGCSKKQKTEFEFALDEAGANKIELQKVLTHYGEHPKDSLKYRAACFLIENMPYHSFYKGDELRKYYKYFECIKGRYNEIVKIKDSLVRADGNFDVSQLDIQRDIDTIDSAYLIHNIDWAFKVWQEQPWGKNVTFEDFCEYILPYRIGNELPIEWREKIYAEFNPMLDSLINTPQASDPAFVAKYLFDSISKMPTTFTLNLPQGPHLGPQIVDIRSGSCRELCDALVYIYRSIGLPCGTDYIVRADGNTNHFWAFVKSENGNAFAIDLLVNSFVPAHELSIVKGKVHRNTFSLNRLLLSQMGKSHSRTHPLFQKPLFVDVTPDYAGEWNRNLKLPTGILYDKAIPNEILYLCISKNLNWIPIDWTFCAADSLQFTNVEGDIVARLGKWDGTKLVMNSDPFLVDKATGNITYYQGTSKSDTVLLYYKFHLYAEHYRPRMINGVFEGSNNKNFSNADTLFKIEKAPQRLFTTSFITSPKKYRYVRYKGGKGSYCNVAEIIFYEHYSDTNALKGRIIGTPGCFQKDGSHEYTNAFDGDPYTSFDYIDNSSGWTGLDLGKPHAIEKIMYAPRNRDNYIRQGDNYELFYWKDRTWNSAGGKKADSDSLVYIVPHGVLLYLKNHTRGKDERIFEYRDGEQIFW